MKPNMKESLKKINAGLTEKMKEWASEVSKAKVSVKEEQPKEKKRAKGKR